MPIKRLIGGLFNNVNKTQGFNPCVFRFISGVFLRRAKVFKLPPAEFDLITLLPVFTV